LATNTPILGLKKPVPNVEENWAFRINESLDILDQSLLVGNASSKENVTTFNDGVGHLLISGSTNPVFDHVEAITINTDYITVATGTFTNILGDEITTTSGFFDDIVVNGVSLATQTPVDNSFKLVFNAVDRKAAATVGGTFTSGAWRVRTLNEVDQNDLPSASLSSDTITLGPGNYYIEWSAPAYKVNRHQSILYNVTAGSTWVQGSSEYSSQSYNNQTKSLGSGQFTLGETSDLQIWHRCEFTHATFGFGVDSNFGINSIYTQVMIWSIDPNIAAFDTVLATSGTFAESLISNGQTTIILPADENFLIDGSTNPREITVGAFRQLHTPAIPGTRALNYVIDINNQADTSAIVTEYTATGLATTSGGTAFKITVDTANSTGGVVEGYHITAVGSGTAAVHAMHAGPGVAPIEHESGAFGNIDTAFTYDDSGASFADVTTSFASGSINTSLWDEDDDLVYIGEDATFSAVSFILDTSASGPGIKPEFEFWNGAIWSSFGPFDGTNGMRVNGIITWSVVDLSGWSTTSVDGATKYWIRIRRTANSLTTPPVEELVQRTSTFQYSWDADANVNVNTLTAGTGLTVSGVPVHIGDVISQYSVDPSPSVSGTVWINTTTSGLRWNVNGTVFEVQGAEV
jgi:hypothetical protein